MSLAAELGAFVCGMGVGALLRTLVAGLRPLKARCAWCGRVHVSTSGQACAACLEAVAREGRAAPDGWPEA